MKKKKDNPTNLPRIRTQKRNLDSCFCYLTASILPTIIFIYLTFTQKSHKDVRGLNRVDSFQEGNIRYLKGDFLEAVKQYMKAIEENEGNAMAWANLGNSYRELGRLNDAILSHRKAVNLTPNRARSYYNLGVTLQTNNQLTDAIAQYDRAIDLESSYVNAIYNKALAYHELNDVRNAIDAYSAVISLKPDFLDALLNLCNVYLADGLRDFEEMKSCYNHILEKDPYYVRGIVNLGALYHARSEFNDARDCYLRALTVDPENVMASHALRALQGGSSIGDKSGTDPTHGSEVAYIRELFDSYSSHFEASLSKLQYNSPANIATTMHDMLLTFADVPETVRVLDLGCGTGLVCPALRTALSFLFPPSPSTTTTTTTDMGSNPRHQLHVTGVDLSAKMVVRAESKRCYDSLAVQEVGAYLMDAAAAAAGESVNSFHFVVAADVFVYLGDLTEVLAACRAVLTKGGVVVFTVEALDDGGQSVDGDDASSSDGDISDIQGSAQRGFQLMSTGRFAHSKDHVLRASRAAGFVDVVVTASILRVDKGQSVLGYLVVLRV